MRRQEIEQHQVAFAGHGPLSLIRKLLSFPKNTVADGGRSQPVETVAKMSEEPLLFSRVCHLGARLLRVNPLLFRRGDQQLVPSVVDVDLLTSCLPAMAER